MEVFDGFVLEVLDGVEWMSLIYHLHAFSGDGTGQGTAVMEHFPHTLPHHRTMCYLCCHHVTRSSQYSLRVGELTENTKPLIIHIVLVQRI